MWLDEPFLQLSIAAMHLAMASRKCQVPTLSKALTLLRRPSYQLQLLISPAITNSQRKRQRMRKLLGVTVIWSQQRLVESRGLADVGGSRWKRVHISEPVQPRACDLRDVRALFDSFEAGLNR